MLVPGLVLVAVAGLEVSDRYWTIRELVVLSPLAAAMFEGPVLTTVYAVAALVVFVLLGWYDSLAATGGGWTAEFIRLGGVLAGVVMAIFVSRYNTRRETRLANVSRVADAAQRAILTDVASLQPGGADATCRGLPRLAVRYESAAAEAMVGGDLYEAVQSPWGLRLLVGDARGKGLDAVRLASRVLGVFRVLARQRPRLAELLADLDAEVTRAGDLDDFVTGVVAQLAGDRLTIASAGHPDPVLLRGGEAQMLALPRRDSPFGLGAGGDDATVTIRVQPGDRLLFYTDGIAEARSPRDRAFFPLLAAARRALGGGGSLDDGLGELARSVRDWTGSRLEDDVALLVVEIPGNGQPAGAGQAAGANGDAVRRSRPEAGTVAMGAGGSAAGHRGRRR
ncbi:MAG: serine/threonine-protein phosphatase [Frankia sp.]|nr:serine/threonine-protein phosphatase [Frankia sp.]